MMNRIGFIAISIFLMSFIISKPCEMKFLGEKKEIIDSVQILFNYNYKIDLLNSECEYALQEDCYNTIPDENMGKLIIIYLEKTSVSEKLDYQKLKSLVKSKKANFVKAVFVYEVKSGFHKLYKGKEEVKLALEK